MQLTMFDLGAIAPTMPPTGLVRACLDMLLAGRRLDHPRFEAETGSWRLAAYVGTLRRLGWPVESVSEPVGEHRNVARYYFTPEALREIRAALGKCPSCGCTGSLASFSAAPMASHQAAEENALEARK